MLIRGSKYFRVVYVARGLSNSVVFVLFRLDFTMARQRRRGLYQNTHRLVRTEFMKIFPGEHPMADVPLPDVKK
jgi:hypothetical protein